MSSPSSSPEGTSGKPVEGTSASSHAVSPLGISVVVALLSLFLFALMGWQVASWQQQARELSLLTQARALADAVARVDTSTDEGSAQLQSRFEGIRQAMPTLTEGLVLEGTSFVAHTQAALAGTRLSREDLNHKQLYDDAKELEGALDRNREERATYSDLKRNPFATSLVRVGEAGLTATVPVMGADGSMRGTLVLKADPPRFPSTPLATQLALAAGVAIGLAFVVGRSGSRVLVAVVGTLWMMAASTVVFLQVEQASSILRQQVGTGAAQVYPVWKTLGGETTSDPGMYLSALNVGVNGDPMSWLSELGEVNPPAESVQHAGVWVKAGRDLRVDSTWTWRGLQAVAMGMVLWLVLLVTGWTRRIASDVVEYSYAYAYVAPAVIGTAVLVFGPFVFGFVLGFYTRVYNEYEFVGLQNFVQILSDFSITQTKNFYRTLGVTVMWTVINVTLHVSIGLALALMLKDKSLRFTPVYRTLLVVPWALPNYITALIWKGMFNKEYGAVNALLEATGVGSVSWFNSFWGAFAANLATNVWLGFPFMMVVSLGALQSIPTELYEAADVDGAGPWDKFVRITLPLLKPALFPAIILGIIWTFNQFNVIYLVSGGAPDGETDILITEAYRWAFEGRQQYGYASAYSTIIFVILFTYTYITNKITKSTEGAYA